MNTSEKFPQHSCLYEVRIPNTGKLNTTAVKCMKHVIRRLVAEQERTIQYTYHLISSGLPYSQ